MRLTRRHVLAGSALVAAASVGGVGVHWWDQPNAGVLQVLSTDEAAIVDALAEAAYPTGGDPEIGGREAGAAAYLDMILSGMVPTQRNLLRVALHAIDAFPLLTHGSHLTELPPADAARVLADGLASSMVEIRAIFLMFYLFVGIAYTSHPDVSGRLRPHFGCGFGR